MQQVEDKIQKAREIYYRRNGIKYRGEKEKKKHSISMGWIILLVLIIGIYGFQYKDFLMSADFKEKVRVFLNTPINFNNIKELFGAHKVQENTNEKVQEKVDEKPEAEEENNESLESEVVETPENTAVIWPFSGTVTSGFGQRESTDSRVSADHTGIDIAGNERR